MNIFRHCLRAANVSPPTGTKTWKSLLEGKHKTSASSPQSIGILSKERSVPENATFSPKSLSVSNDSLEKGHHASNKSLRQSMENDAVSVRGPENIFEDNARSEEDHVVDLEHLPDALETLPPDPARDGPSRSVLQGPHEIEDLKELSLSNRVIWRGDVAEIGYSSPSQASDRAESQHQTQEHGPFESRSRWHQKNHMDRAQRDFRFGSGRHLRRTHLHQQLNPPQPQYPLTETRHTTFPPQNQQTQSVNDAGNQFQSWPTLNYNFAPGYLGQVPAGNGMRPHVQSPDYSSLQGSEQSGGKLRSSQAYYSQMWQYYYYYQQQQNFLQQQMQQLQQTQAQLQQQLQSPEYQTVSQQINQLQQQQQHLYQQQQLLYQQMQQQQPPLQQQQPAPPLQQQSLPQQQQLNLALQVPQQDLPFYTQSQQLPELQQSFQQQRLDQSGKPQVQQDQLSKQQQQIIEEEELEEEQEVKDHQPECIP